MKEMFGHMVQRDKDSAYRKHCHFPDIVLSIVRDVFLTGSTWYEEDDDLEQSPWRTCAFSHEVFGCGIVGPPFLVSRRSKTTTVFHKTSNVPCRDFFSLLRILAVAGSCSSMVEAGLQLIMIADSFPFIYSGVCHQYLWWAVGGVYSGFQLGYI